MMRRRSAKEREAVKKKEKEIKASQKAKRRD